MKLVFKSILIVLAISIAKPSFAGNSNSKFAWPYAKYLEEDDDDDSIPGMFSLKARAEEELEAAAGTAPRDPFDPRPGGGSGVDLTLMLPDDVWPYIFKHSLWSAIQSISVTCKRLRTLRESPIGIETKKAAQAT